MTGALLPSLLGLGGILGVATSISAIVGTPDAAWRNIRERIGTFWWLWAGLAVTLMLGPVGVIVVSTAVAYYASNELRPLLTGGQWSPTAHRTWRVVLLSLPLTCFALAYAHSTVALLLILALTTLNDVSQYVWGRSLGRHKLAPRLSPNKTIEGALGGIATTTLLSVLVAPVLVGVSAPHAALLGVAIGVSGIAGDLLVSWLKRRANVKDTGTALPGHGGVLDRLDSLLLTAPVALLSLSVSV